MKKSVVNFAVVAVCLVSLLFVGGCAKKTVLKEEGPAGDKPALAKESSQAEIKAAKETDKQRQEKARKEALAKEKTAAEAVKKEVSKKAMTEATAKEVAKRAASEAEAKKAKPAKQELISLSNIHFDFDKYNLKAEAQAMLKQHADWLGKNKNFNITIEGHCDERGTAEYNLALGQRRAEEAVKHLMELGIDKRRIKSLSYGEEKPLDPGHDEDAWAKNRRDQFVLEQQR